MQGLRLGGQTGVFGAVSVLLPLIAVGLLAAPAGAKLPSPPGPVGLGAAETRIDGATAGDLSGSSVSDAGDVNGDGRGDLIVGAPGADQNGRAESGSAYVLFGPPPAVVDLNNLGGNGFRIDGAVAGDFAGISVAGAGDFNQDGLDDVLVGAVDIMMTVPGKAYVVFGKASTATVDLVALGAGGLAIVGNTSDRAGAAVAGAADVNGDGAADLAIAAPFTGKQGRNDNGSVYVVFGPRGAGALNLDALGAGFRIDGAADNEFLGETGVALGDTGGDGRAELVAGTRFSANNGRIGSGSAHVIFGKASNTVVDTASTGAAGFRIDGAAAGDQAGSAVAVLPDHDGDALAEVIVGSPRADGNGRTDSGGAHVVWGKSNASNIDLAALGSGGRRIDGAAAGGMLGLSVAGWADLDADNRGDPLLAAPNLNGGAGSAYGLRGEPPTAALDLASLGSAGHAIAGAGGSSGIGPVESLAAVGDLNGDRRHEVLAAHPLADNNGRTDSGSTHLFLGPDSSPGKCANPLFGTSSNDDLGGTERGDQIEGGPGKDKLKGRKGKDCLVGGPGKDTAKGGPAKDSFRGGGGNDKLNSRDGRRGEKVNCGGGRKDKVVADKGDKVASNCERVKRR